LGRAAHVRLQLSHGVITPNEIKITHRQDVVANTLNLFRNWSVGFIDWLGSDGRKPTAQVALKSGLIKISKLILGENFWNFSLQSLDDNSASLIMAQWNHVRQV